MYGLELVVVVPRRVTCCHWLAPEIGEELTTLAVAAKPVEPIRPGESLTVQPAATVPVGTDADGLPIGLQIVGPRHADSLVLRTAHALYEAGVAVTPPAPR